MQHIIATNINANRHGRVTLRQRWVILLGWLRGINNLWVMVLSAIGLIWMYFEAEVPFYVVGVFISWGALLCMVRRRVDLPIYGGYGHGVKAITGRLEIMTADKPDHYWLIVDEIRFVVSKKLTPLQTIMQHSWGTVYYLPRSMTFLSVDLYPKYP